MGVSLLMSKPRAPVSSTQRLLLVVTVILIFLMAARTPLDSDMWWHLRAGEQTLRDGRPLLVDVFSHTRYGAAWINHSWLSQVGMALLYRWGGFLALGGAMALLATLSMALALAQCHGPAALKSAALVLGGVVASVVWGPRPQLASLVLLAAVGYVLYLWKWRRVNRLWLLPPLFWLWSNLHGGYALGFLLIGFALAGEILNLTLRLPVEAPISRRGLGILALWTGLSALTILINPNGLGVWRIPFQTVNVGALQQFISEWSSPDFHDPLQQALLVLLFAVFASAALMGRPIDGADLTVVVGFALLALVARRNFGPFALVAVPVLTRCADCAVQSWQARAPWPTWAMRLWSGESAPVGRGAWAFRAVNLALAGVLIFAALIKLYAVTYPALVYAYLGQQAPARAAAWLEQHPMPELRLINEYNWGGYLVWALPHTPVFVDGRTDLFGDEVIGDWIIAVQAGAGWEQTLQKWDVGMALLEPDRPLAAKLREQGWRLLYQDDQAVIYADPRKLR